MPFTVAIVGRPNVGKSTLFNRLTRKRAAIVDDTPGVTRDWREGPVQLMDLAFRALDTAGIDDAKDSPLAERIQAQTQFAIAHADVVVFVIDAREGLTPHDREAARLLRKTEKPVLLVANKCDTSVGIASLDEAFALGFGEPIAVSATHGTGIDTLYDALLPFAPDDAIAKDDEETKPEKRLTIAITGRPNAGKSTLLNRLLGKDRSITGPEAGITRDAVAADWVWQGKPIRLVDTAGLRRKSRVSEGLEKLAVADALGEIGMAEVVILVIDALAPFETQDLQIADLVEREGRAMVIAVNKWDLVENKVKTLRALKSRIDELLPQWRGVAMVALSALSGDGIERLIPAVITQYDIWNKRVATHRLNQWLEAALERHSPPAPKGRRIRIKYMTQARARPPTFAIFANQAGELPDDYSRYLINGLRDTFGFHGVPIRMRIKAQENPFAKAAMKRGDNRKRDKPGKSPLGKIEAEIAIAKPRHVDDQVKEILAWLEKRGTKKNRDGMARFAIVAPKSFGVSMATMKALVKKTPRNHELALALWDSGWHEARALASLLDEPDRVTPAQMDAWAKSFCNWADCDTACFALFDRTPHAFKKVQQWAKRREEFVKRAAFALLASVALHDRKAVNAKFLACLPLIESAASDERNFVKKGVNWALRAIGERNTALNAPAVKLAERLARSDLPSARWIGKDALRQLKSAASIKRLAMRDKRYAAKA